MPTLSPSNSNVKNIPFLLGAGDAESSALCLPELFFVTREPVLAYVSGYESVAGETTLSRQMKDICAGNICGGDN
jgi:hypothetical protein